MHLELIFLYLQIAGYSKGKKTVVSSNLHNMLRYDFAQSYPGIKKDQTKKYVFSLDIEASPKVLQFDYYIL